MGFQGKESFAKTEYPESAPRPLSSSVKGGRTITADHSAAKGRAVVLRVTQADGEACFRYVNLTDDASIAHRISAVAESVPALHGLANSAGIYRQASIMNTTPEHRNTHIQVNLRAVVLLTRGLLPLMRKEGGAIASLASEEASFITATTHT